MKYRMSNYVTLDDEIGNYSENEEGKNEEKYFC